MFKERCIQAGLDENIFTFSATYGFKGIELKNPLAAKRLYNSEITSQNHGRRNVFKQLARRRDGIRESDKRQAYVEKNSLSFDFESIYKSKV